MDDDIDYNELFGVTPEGGEASPAGEAETPDAGAETEPPVGAGGAVSDSDTIAQGQELGRGQVPGSKGSPREPSSDTTGQEGPDVQGAVSESDTEPEQGAEAGGDRHSDLPNDRSGSLPTASDQARAQYEAVIARAQADAQRAIDEAFQNSGLKNPYTGQPITSKAEYDAYKERFDAERREQLMRGAGMSGEEFDRFVQDLPEVRRAREAQEAAERAQREAREAAARVRLDEQLREISAIDPSVKSLADLAKMPTYPRFYELVQRGNTLTDAFRLANFDALAQRSAAGARQAAVNAARSKEHLEQTKTRGTGAVSVPADVREQYRLFNPDATDEEIQKHYQKSHKEG